jgi:thiamine pyrophosphate-dependent acetolactate synthase large subunit-like protein
MLMVGTAFQAIGLGLASVAGAAAAKPSSTVVLTTGDGGGLMALSELETAVRVAGGRGIAVVWNGKSYGSKTASH